MIILTILKVLSYGILIDVIWVFYILHVNDRMKVRASILSSMMAAPALFGFIDVISNKFLAVPYLLGLGIGTFTGMTLHEKIEEKRQKDKK